MRRKHACGAVPVGVAVGAIAFSLLPASARVQAAPSRLVHRPASESGVPPVCTNFAATGDAPPGADSPPLTGYTKMSFTCTSLTRYNVPGNALELTVETSPGYPAAFALLSPTPNVASYIGSDENDYHAGTLSIGYPQLKSGPFLVHWLQTVNGYPGQGGQLSSCGLYVNATIILDEPGNKTTVIASAHGMVAGCHHPGNTVSGAVSAHNPFTSADHDASIALDDVDEGVADLVDALLDEHTNLAQFHKYVTLMKGVRLNAVDDLKSALSVLRSLRLLSPADRSRRDAAIAEIGKALETLDESLDNPQLPAVETELRAVETDLRAAEQVM